DADVVAAFVADERLDVLVEGALRNERERVGVVPGMELRALRRGLVDRVECVLRDGVDRRLFVERDVDDGLALLEVADDGDGLGRGVRFVARGRTLAVALVDLRSLGRRPGRSLAKVTGLAGGGGGRGRISFGPAGIFAEARLSGARGTPGRDQCQSNE